MKKNEIIIYFLFFQSFTIAAQDTFNKSITLGYPYTNFTALTINDTSIFCAGIYVDSMPPFAQGAFLYEMDMQGEILKEYAIADSTGLRHFWERNLTWINDTTILNIGYYKSPLDEWSKGLIVEYDIKNKEIKTEKYLESPVMGMQTHGIRKGFDGDFKLTVNNGEFFSSFMTLDTTYEIKNFEYINSSSSRAFFSGSMMRGKDKYYIASVKSNLNTANRGFIMQNLITVFDSIDQKMMVYQTPSSELWDWPESIHPTIDGGLLITANTGEERMTGVRFGRISNCRI